MNAVVPMTVIPPYLPVTIALGGIRVPVKRVTLEMEEHVQVSLNILPFLQFNFKKFLCFSVHIFLLQIIVNNSMFNATSCRYMA